MARRMPWSACDGLAARSEQDPQLCASACPSSHHINFMYVDQMRLAMSAPDLSRSTTANELREQAKRYRDLALCIGDRRAIEIIERTARECEERAAEIERDVFERLRGCAA
jgi:hypothetical protein